MAETAIQRGLQRIVVHRSAAGLEVDFSETISKLTGDNSVAVCGICGHPGDLIRNSAQKEIPPLAANVSDSQNSLAWQLLLDRCGVRSDPLWDAVSRPICSG